MSGLQFSTTQMRELTHIKREQLRHWRKVLRPLSGRDGRSDLYGFREVLALAAMAELADRLGIPVSHLDRCASDLFALFAEAELGQLPAKLHLTGLGDLVHEEPEDAAFATIRPETVYTAVRERLAPDQRVQLALPL